MAERTIGAARTIECIDWRYVHHPVGDYRFFVVDHSDGPGIAVWRSEELEEGELRNPGAIGLVMEIFAPTATNANHLVKALVTALQSADVFGADFTGYNGFLGDVFLGSGFHLVENKIDGTNTPCRFQPIDTAMTTLNSAIFVSDMGPESLFSETCPWIWTKGDGDMDRP